MDKICPYCQGQHLIKNGSAYGVPKWKCKDCLRQTSFKPPRGEPLWKKETAVLLYTLGLSMNAIAKQLGVSTPSILNWIRAHAATHAPRPQPEPGESVVVMELDELWHFLQKKEQAVPNSRVSGLSRLSRHKREVVGEELSGHSVHEAWKVPRLSCLGGEHLREFADGGFHGAPGPHQTGDGTGITVVRHVLAQRRLEVDVVGRRLGLQLARNETLVADQQDLVVEVGDHVAFVDVGGGHREGHRCARQSDDQMAAQAVEMLLLGRAVAPCRFAPEGPASVAPTGVTDRDRKAVENVYGVTGRKQELQDPLLDQRQRRALSGEGWVGSESRKEGPPMPGEVPVDGRVIVTALLLTEDLHRQDLDVGQLRVRAAVPQSAAERHPPVGVIDQQVEQDERFFQAASRRPHGQT